MNNNLSHLYRTLSSSKYFYSHYLSYVLLASQGGCSDGNHDLLFSNDTGARQGGTSVHPALPVPIERAPAHRPSSSDHI